MSDRNNTDNQNTNTIYIPRDMQNRQTPRKPLRRVQQNPPQYGNQPYGGQSMQNPSQYGNQPYGGQPMQNPSQYGNQPYGGQSMQNPPQYGNQPYGGQPMQNPPQYGNQPYYDDYYREPPRNYPQNSGNPPKRATESKSGNPQQKKKKRRKKSPVGKFFGRFIRTLLIIFLVIFGMYSCTSISLINKMDYVATGSRNRRSDALSRSYVKNVLLIGTDGRTEDEAARSDTMIIASINSRTDEISLISLMRDCYVVIPGYGENKLNAAYSFGGAELLMDTIEYNFGIAVEDYVSVNFVSFANVVDSVGGIDIEISDAEAQEINTIMQAEVNSIMGDDILDDLLDGGGELHLNGKQALSYARIRYIGNADFERTERQRRVIELVMDKVKSFNPAILPNVASSVLPGVETNMSTAELYWLSLKAPFIVGYERQQLQVPAEGTYYGEYRDCGDSLIVDFNANYNLIYETAYKDQKIQNDQ